MNFNPNFPSSRKAELNWKIDKDWTPNIETTTTESVCGSKTMWKENAERQSRKTLIDCGREYSTL